MNFDFNSIRDELIAAIKKDPYERMPCQAAFETWGGNADKNDWVEAFKDFIEKEPSLELKRGRFGGVKLVKQTRSIKTNTETIQQNIEQNTDQNDRVASNEVDLVEDSPKMGPDPSDIGRSWAETASNSILEKLRDAISHKNIQESTFSIDGQKFVLKWPRSKFIEFMNIFINSKSENCEIQNILFEDKIFEVDKAIMPMLNQLLIFCERNEIWELRKK